MSIESDVVHDVITECAGHNRIMVDGPRFSGKTYICKSIADKNNYDYYTTLGDRKNMSRHLEWLPMHYAGLFVLDFISQLSSTSMRGLVIDRSNITCLVFNNDIDPDKSMYTFKHMLTESNVKLVILNPSSSVLSRNVLSRTGQHCSKALLPELMDESQKYLDVVNKYHIPCSVIKYD